MCTICVRYASFGNVKISDIDFADDAVIFAETLEILLEALEVLNEESEPLGFQVSWVKTRSRLSMTSWMLPSCLYRFVARMLRSRRDSLPLAVIFMSPRLVSQRSTDVCVGLGSHGFTGSWGVAPPIPVREDESPSLQDLGASSLDL